MRLVKKILFILLLILSNGCSNEELVLDKSEVTLDKKTGIVNFNGIPFSGVVVTEYKNGGLAEKTAYKNGKKGGSSEKYFDSGILSYKCNYTNGSKVDTSRTWWKNGNLRSESVFVNGTPHGVHKEWYKSGAIFKQLTLNYGKEEGIQKSWRENGKIYNNYEAKDGRIFGLKKSKLCFTLKDETLKEKNPS